MEYIHRTLERKFLHMSSFFKVVLVTGARQVGKTTMLKHLAQGEHRTYVTLDNTMTCALARSDPALFFQTYRPPIIIDEVQKAPELFGQIKMICDETEERGLFWLTGSQQYETMKNIRETLAGRVGILELYSLTKDEADGRIFSNRMDFSLACLRERQVTAERNNIAEIFAFIWRGGMPEVRSADAEQMQAYFDSYIATYVMRDVAEAGRITDTVRFRKFLNACAALTAQQVNYKNLAEAAEISQPTAKEWLRLLESLGIVFLLQPYANNTLKRLTRTPKMYFADTGLCAYLSMWLTRDTLMNGAASGMFFENYVVSALLKNFAYSPDGAKLTYYRDANAKEIDVFVEENGLIHPLEIKKSANPDSRDVKKFDLLEKVGLNRGAGGIVCMCEEAIPIDEQNSFIPCNLI